MLLFPLYLDPLRCQRAFAGNTIGQANAVVADKSLDLRSCDFVGKDLSEVNFAGALMFDANFKEANLESVSGQGEGSVIDDTMIR